MPIDALASSSSASGVATVAARVGDPEATQTVYTTIVVLIVLGVVLLALAVWVFRRTRPDVELLAPLETMQTRGWRKLNPAAQRRMLDESRPPGAVPLHREASPPEVDRSFAVVAPVTSFDDLSGDEDPEGAEDPEGDEATDLDETTESERRVVPADEDDVPEDGVPEDDDLEDGDERDSTPVGRSIDPLLTPRRTGADRG